MVWLGPPSRGVPRPRLHDPPYPGYRPNEPGVPLKDQQRRARRDRALLRAATVVLVPTAAAILAMICVLIAMHV